MIEFITAIIFLIAIVAGYIISDISSRKRAANAAAENAKPCINWALIDARRLGCPL